MRNRLIFICLSLGLTNCNSTVNLPQVLIIGDSISIGYLPYVQELLAGQAIVDRVPLKPDGKPENCQGTTYGLANLDRWLAGGEWDIIHFNFGLHDIKHINPKTDLNSTDPNHPPQADLNQYEENLKAIVDQLKTSKAKLIFATTTPYPAGTRPYRGYQDEIKYNNVALKIMRENEIEVNDLHGFILPFLGSLQKPVNVHFTDEGSRKLAEKVAAQIVKNL